MTNRIEIEFAYGARHLGPYLREQRSPSLERQWAIVPKSWAGSFGRTPWSYAKTDNDPVRIETPVLGNETNRVVRELVNTSVPGSDGSLSVCPDRDDLWRLRRHSMTRCWHSWGCCRAQRGAYGEARWVRERAMRSMERGAFSEAEGYLKGCGVLDPEARQRRRCGTTFKVPEGGGGSEH